MEGLWQGKRSGKGNRITGGAAKADIEGDPTVREFLHGRPAPS